MPAPASDVTPARLSYLNGEVSFWRPGAQEWTPAKVNMPLAPGDLLYTGQGGNLEIQVGPRAFVRASEGTHIGLDNQEPDFVQFRLTAGHAALDVRELAAGHAVELDTPHGAFTVERIGYYHAEVTQEFTAFDTHRGGSATVTPAGGAATPVAANQQVMITGTDSPRVEMAAAPPLSAWDRWNYQRTDYLLQPASTQYVSPAVYGGEALNQYGGWRTVETYGSVWVPTAVPVGWVPYSTGRWIWDPRFGWTWLDDAPWGWAPYHYGRWVFVGNYWAWAPGPVVIRPAYAPALVVFLGGGVVVTAGRPLYWAPLGWGEPVIPWWGRPGFVGVASWRGWGGPRVVNNVVVNRTTNVNVTNITVYRNVHVTNAVVGVPAERFGQGQVQTTQISQAQVQQLTPVHGALAVRPVAASVQPATGSAAPPPAAIQARPVVANWFRRRGPHLRPRMLRLRQRAVRLGLRARSLAPAASRRLRRWRESRAPQSRRRRLRHRPRPRLRHRLHPATPGAPMPPMHLMREETSGPSWSPNAMRSSHRRPRRGRGRRSRPRVACRLRRRLRLSRRGVSGRRRGQPRLRGHPRPLPHRPSARLTRSHPSEVSGDGFLRRTAHEASIGDHGISGLGKPRRGPSGKRTAYRQARSTCGREQSREREG